LARAAFYPLSLHDALPIFELERSEEAARLLVAAAERRPEDRSLVRTAERLAHQVGDHELLEQVLQAVPANERLAGLFDIAARCRETGQLSQAIDALKRALAIEGTGKEA